MRMAARVQVKALQKELQQQGEDLARVRRMIVSGDEEIDELRRVNRLINEKKAQLEDRILTLACELAKKVDESAWRLAELRAQHRVSTPNQNPPDTKDAR